MFWGRIFSSQSDCEKGSRALSTCIVVVQLTAGAIREIDAAVQTPTAGIQNTSAIIQVTPGAPSRSQRRSSRTHQHRTTYDWHCLNNHLGNLETYFRRSTQGCRSPTHHLRSTAQRYSPAIWFMDVSSLASVKIVIL
jgi:hypothetical protein